MKAFPLLPLLLLAACGGKSGQSAEEAASSTTTDAVTAEAVTDTQAAEADALKAADAALDRLDNSIDDPAPAEGRAKGGDRVSNTTQVTVY